MDRELFKTGLDQLVLRLGAGGTQYQEAIRLITDGIFGAKPTPQPTPGRWASSRQPRTDALWRVIDPEAEYTVCQYISACDVPMLLYAREAINLLRETLLNLSGRDEVPEKICYQIGRLLAKVDGWTPTKGEYYGRQVDD